MSKSKSVLLLIALFVALSVAACRGREQATPPPQPTPPSVIQQPAQPTQPSVGKQPTQPPAQPPAGKQPTPTPPAPPDLTISEATVTPTGNPGEVRIHIVARNQGGPISAAFTIRWHPHQKDRTQVGCSQDFYNLNQNEWVVDCAYIYPANQRGEMHWVAVVDARNDVKNESNENNNEKTGTMTIGSSGGPTQPPTGQAPPAPTNCKATQIDTRTIRVEWQFAGQADGFRIYQGKTSLEATVNASARSWTIADLPPNVQHHFDVRAYNASGESRADACSVDVTRR